MSATIRVLLVDDHALVRESLGSWLDNAPDIAVVGTADNSAAGIDQVRAHQPDVVLLDIDMSGSLSFEAARRMREDCPQTRIVFLSAYVHDHYINEALAIGASGYMTKGEPASEVLRAVRQVVGGTAFFSPDVEARIVFDGQRMRLARTPRARVATLSSRELEILRFIAQGLSKKEIAAQAHLSERTVNRHCSNLMDKLAIHDRVELARFAIREGLAEP